MSHQRINQDIEWVSGQLEDFIQVANTFDPPPPHRQTILRELARAVGNSIEKQGKAQLVFICTHNSRRSHLAQVWAQAAAWAFGLDQVTSFSGGTEATAFHPAAVRALGDAGMKISRLDEGPNPNYSIVLTDRKPAIRGFSKVFSASANPDRGFIAVMVCSDAEEACPFVPGADTRFSLPYTDPKRADGTSHEAEEYAERSLQIAGEMFYLMSLVKDI